MAFKHFNHLNVPDGWERYFTKYPQGMTILEALFEWVSQVDSMVDNQNNLNDNVVQFRTEIDDFIGRFDERLQTEVTQVLNDWQNSGFLDVVISEALQWQLTDYIATNEADKTSLTAQVQQNTVQVKDTVINASLLGITQQSTAQEMETILNAPSLPAGSTVNFNGVYTFDKPVTLNKRLKLTANHATFIFSTNYHAQNNGDELVMLKLNADGITITGIDFRTPSGLLKGQVNNTYIWGNRGKTIIKNCSFYDLPVKGNNFNGAIGFMITGQGFNIVDSCYFENCPGGVFSKQPNDTISNCISKHPHDVSFVLNGETSINSKIIGCTVVSPQNSVAMHIGVEQGVSDFLIANNTIQGVKDGIGIGAITVGFFSIIGDGGIISNNVINGLNLSSTSPTAGIVVVKGFTNILIHDNIIKNIGLGNGSNVGMLLTVGSGSTLKAHNNRVINAQSNYPVHIIIDDTASELELKDNYINGGGKSYCVYINGTVAPQATIIIENNTFRNASEGINASKITEILELTVINNRFISITSPLNAVILGGTIILTGFNVHGKNFPHRISNRYHSEFYSNSTVSTPTNGNWVIGDIIYFTNPVIGTTYGRICVEGGIGGTWKTFGNISS